MRQSMQWLATGILVLAPFATPAVQPYLAADKVEGGDLSVAMASVESKLTAAGFTVVGRHRPKGVEAGTVVVTDPDLLAAIREIGGSAIITAPIRIGVQKNGTVSTINPEYWWRAFAGDNYPRLAKAEAAVDERLHKALNTGVPFGGEVSAEQLPRYHYMLGMERFADRALIAQYSGFDQALKIVQGNLDKGIGGTAKVYEVVLPDAKLAVIGFAQNDPERGEGWWVNRLGGADHIAALPWEVFIVDGKIYALYGRFRTALAWPTLGMGQFMTIMHHPDATLRMAKDIAGVGN